MLRSCISLNSRSIRSAALTVAMCATVTLQLLMGAHAAAYTYSSQQRTINAGVLLLDSMKDPGPGAGTEDYNPKPYIFYVLDQRNDLKPFGWSFVNPGAPQIVTADIKTRWDNIMSPGTSGYTLGQPIQSNMAPYWEVRLTDLNSTNISQYDLLFLRLTGSGAYRFARHDAEVLRRFVDGGGVLWIETSAGASVNEASPNGYDLFFGAIVSSSGANTSGATVPIFGTTPYRHPIISSPYLLSRNDLNLLPGVSSGDSVLDNSKLLAPVVLNASNGKSIIVAAQYGAGEIVVSTAQAADKINDSARSPSGAFTNDRSYSGGDLNIVTPSLSASCKLAYNIIAWSGTHPQERQNSHQSNSTRDALASAFTQAWNFSFAGAAVSSDPLPGAAVFGKIAVVRDSSGVLRAFDTVPAEHLFGTLNADDGKTDFSTGTDYDELWELPVGTLASAPTIATLPSGETVVMVQMPTGDINLYNLSTGIAATPATLTPSVAALGVGGITYTASTPMTPNTGPATAPTYYAGRVFAALHLANGQPALYMYDFNDATDTATVFLNPNHTASVTTVTADEWPTASPSVGVLAWEQTSLIVNDITLFVPTRSAVYSVLLGIRGDQLTGSGTLNTRLANMTSTGISMDISSGLSTSVLSIFSTPTLGQPTYYSPNPVTPANVAFVDPTAPGITAYYANYDTKFISASTPQLTRLVIPTVSSTSGRYPTAKTTISAPAMDNLENIFYTVNDPDGPGGPALLNSVICCVHDSKEPSARKLRWRFRLPHTGDNIVDADGIIYNDLAGYYFVGSPVVDERGFVYVAAAKPGTGFAILCFDNNRGVSADMYDPNGGDTGTAAVSQITQPYGSGTEFSAGESPAGVLKGDQYFVSGNQISFSSFAPTAAGTPGPMILYPNLNEPNPISVTYTVTANGQTGATTSATVRPLHTNLAWYTLVNAPANITGLAKVGDYLYLGGSGSTATDPAPLYHAYAYPQDKGLIGANRFVDSTKIGLDRPKTISNLTSIDSVPSADNGIMVLNGSIAGGGSGITAVASQTTVVADNNRLIELDANGDAVWSADTTNLLTPATATTPSTTTELELNRPTSISQMDGNNYLVVDSGNNRVVQIDHAGKVAWELNKFTLGASSPTLAPGEPDHLNQPTSAQTWNEFDVATSKTTVHYLITDTGNFRVLEVIDILDVNGNRIVSHQLNWISHTSDMLGREYQYVGATYYTDSLGTKYIVALVNNRRIATNATSIGTMAAASADTPGSSIVMLDYDPGGTNAAQKDGYISYAAGGLQVITQFQAYIDATGKYDTTNNAANLKKAVPLRNPRYLSSYTLWNGILPIQHFLLADDNGVFDLTQPTVTTFISNWGYTARDYSSMITPIDSSLNAYMQRPNIRFTPACVQRTTRDQYLITNSTSQGDPNVPGGFGGEAFEVFSGNNQNVLGNAPPFSGHTFSRPSNSGAIVQPTYAIRPQ